MTSSSPGAVSRLVSKSNAWLTAASAGGAIALAACTAAPSAPGASTAPQLGITQIAPASRGAAPSISGTTLQGARLALSEYRGDIVVMNVWGSWCSDCRAEEPALEETYERYKGEHVQFVGINTRDDNAAALAYASSFGMTYPSLQDPDETLLLRFKSILPSGSIPSTVIVDKQGKVAARIIGSISEPELDHLLDGVLRTG
jgi:thiol-disulfide isomerase/thioredoxin